MTAQTALNNAPFDFIHFLRKQFNFSIKTFGPDQCTAGILDHIRKELVEIEDAPNDLEEWIDVIILSLDGAMRANHSPWQIISCMQSIRVANTCDGLAFDLVDFLNQQHKLSLEILGADQSTTSTLSRIRKELNRIESIPGDLEAWVNVSILAFDGAIRANHTVEQAIAQLQAKQIKNMSRTWPDWRQADINKAMEHIEQPVESSAYEHSIAAALDQIDEEKIRELVGSVHCPGVPNWTSQQTMDAYAQLQALSKHLKLESQSSNG